MGMDFDSPTEGKPRRKCGSLGGVLGQRSGSAAASNSQDRGGQG